MEKKKKNRKGVFIGGYVPAAMKEQLKRQADIKHITLTAHITQILSDALKKEKTK